MFGFVRVFVMFGSIIGFLLCRLTVGRLLSLVYCPLIYSGERICAKISRKIKKILNKNKGIFRNNDNNSVEKADSFKNEKKHKERK